MIVLPSKMEYICEGCVAKIYRDINANRNILQEGLEPFGLELAY